MIGEIAQGVIVAAHDVFSGRHDFVVIRIAAHEGVPSVWALDQNHCTAFAAIQVGENFIRKNDPERIADFLNFDLNHGSPAYTFDCSAAIGFSGTAGIRAGRKIKLVVGTNLMDAIKFECESLFTSGGGGRGLGGSG